jgi:acetyl-CoA synthetase
MNAEDPLFILYTSGSTGKPKGVLHTTGGYHVFTAMTHQYVFDYHEGDIYWCTADVGWVTGHSYIVYGPLANGATTLVFEGVPNYPTMSRFWEVCDKQQVNIIYTAPTAIRALMQAGDAPVKKTSRKSLRLLGTVGDDQSGGLGWYYPASSRGPLPDQSHRWLEPKLRDRSRAAGRDRLKPGSATGQFFGVVPGSVPSKVLEARRPTPLHRGIWPEMRACFAITSASSTPLRPSRNIPPAAARGTPQHYWITSRVDGVINVAGSLAFCQVGARWWRMPTCRRRRWSAIRTTSRARASTPT